MLETRELFHVAISAKMKWQDLSMYIALIPNYYPLLSDENPY